MDLTDQGRAWLDQAIEAIERDPEQIFLLFPQAGRKCGRGPIEDAVRLELLERRPEAARPLYERGDAAEKRGVLRALDHLDVDAVPLIEDALRTNDTRLIEAAMGPCSRRLDDHAWRRAVLKCVFVGVPLDRVAGLARRADRELGRMLADFARERLVAVRDVPPEIWPLIDADLMERLLGSGLDRRAAWIAQTGRSTALHRGGI
jgi:hypothetical protein